MAAPIEAKVTGATGGSVAGTALAGAILWFLDSAVFKTDPVPDPLVVLVWVVVPAALTFLGGWLSRHTPRPTDAMSERLAPGAHRSSNVRRVGRYDPVDDADRKSRRADPLA